MAKCLQLRRGTTAQNDAFTGASGELSYDTQVKQLRIHDGTTVGGIKVAMVPAMETALAGKAASVHSHAISDVTNLQSTLDAKASTSTATTSANGLMSSSDKTKLDGINMATKVSVSGSRGSMAGYCSSGNATTINSGSYDCNEAGSAITVSNGSSGTSWTKIVRLTSSVAVYLGSSWGWEGGTAPTIKANGILVLCWCGSRGIAKHVNP